MTTWTNVDDGGKGTKRERARGNKQQFVNRVKGPLGSSKQLPDAVFRYSEITLLLIHLRSHCWL